MQSLVPAIRIWTAQNSLLSHQAAFLSTSKRASTLCSTLDLFLALHLAAESLYVSTCPLARFLLMLDPEFVTSAPHNLVTAYMKQAALNVEIDC